MAEPVDADLQEQVKAVHRSFPTGVAVVTTALEERPYGLVVNAFSSVSLTPPAVLVCVASTAATHDHLLRGDALAVNVMAHDQDDVVATFARSGGDKFAGLGWRPGATGAPLLDGTAGCFEVMVEQRVTAYTHTIFVGRVHAAHASERPPLIYLGGRLHDGGRLALHPNEHRRCATGGT